MKVDSAAVDLIRTVCNVMDGVDAEKVIEDYEELDSTNSEAKRLADGGKSGVFVVSARKQTSGRGRYGRAWYAPADNVAMTIAVPLPFSFLGSPTLPLMTGLAVHDVLQTLVGDRAAVCIKWPNDIVVDDAKISGTLIETSATRIYVGIGVNLVAELPDAIYPTTSLGRFCNIERLALIEMIADRWLAQFQKWTLDGFAPLAAMYTSNIWRRGEEVTIALNEARTDRVTGLCLGVNETGLLQLKLSDGTVRSFSTGDVGA
ncbi:biotin--[acetyl-CoA-carboxylase] ligase [Nitratireductor soli]|uniref:biotin--[acetyl-CoA-carboxylase] ligase n=1 Tax=Nitratireductor soli TaxID=1670619 RepID=UPI00065E9513|nr:biotin--[acetyl-CoA-carboxylase] ligase [Nitratireductor soli]